MTIEPRAVLLVTGSRALQTTQAAKAWCHERLIDLIAQLPLEVYPVPAIVVTGGCEGPDLWADCIAQTYGVPTLQYRLDGFRYLGAERHSSWMRDLPAREPMHAWPLRRNQTMTHDLAQLARHGDRCLVAGFVALWATTHGTEHTLRHARDAHLWTETWTCPTSLGPR